MTTTGSNLDVSAAGGGDGAHPPGDTPYYPVLANPLGCWARHSEGTTGASIQRGPRALVALFSAGPERLFYNTAVLARDLNWSRANEAADAIVRRYEAAEVDHYAIWAHESEQAATAEMTRRGFRV